MADKPTEDGFKQHAVKLARESDAPLAEVAQRLGVNPGVLANWLAEDASPRNGTERAKAADPADFEDLEPPVLPPPPLPPPPPPPPPAPARPAPPGAAPAPYQRFKVGWRGYRRRQVDEHIGRLTQQLSTLAARLADAEHAFELAERRMREAPTQLLPVGKPGSRGIALNVGRLLQAAEREAADVRADAKRQSEEVLENARAKAAEIVATAEQQADQVRTEVREALRGHQDRAERELELLDQIRDQLRDQLRRVRELTAPAIPAQDHTSPENA